MRRPYFSIIRQKQSDSTQSLVYAIFNALKPFLDTIGKIDVHDLMIISK